MLKDRIVFLGKPIDDEATRVIAQILFLKAQAKNRPITLYINSPGGSVTASLAILDTIRDLNAPVHTIGLRHVHSMAAIILTQGTRGYRTALTEATIIFSEIRAVGEITPEKKAHLDSLAAVLVERTARNTGLKAAQVKELFSSSQPLTAIEAMRLGIVDRVMEPTLAHSPELQ